MTPPRLGALSRILGGAALVGVGVGIGARAAERALPCVLAYLLRTEIRLARAERQVGKLQQAFVGAQEDLAELRADIPKVWDRGFEAGQHLAEHQLATAAVERAQRAKARWN